MNIDKCKRFGAVLLLTAAAALTAGCSGSSEDGVNVIRDAGVLKVALVNTESPYTVFDGDAPTGLEPQIAESVGQALGVPVEYQLCDKASALSAVAEGTADIAIGSISQSGQMESMYLTSTPYARGFFYAVTAEGDYVQTIGGLSNSVLGTFGGLDEGSRTQLYQAGGITVNEYADAETAAEDIKNGRIRAYICYENEAKQLLKDKELQVQNLANLDPENYVVVAGKEDQSLVSGINKLIVQILEKE